MRRKREVLRRDQNTASKMNIDELYLDNIFHLNKESSKGTRLKLDELTDLNSELSQSLGKLIVI